MKRQAALSAAASELNTADILDNKGDEDNLTSSDSNLESCADFEIRTISLAQFVSPEDISDEEEYEEIISNIKEIFGPFGALESIVIGIQSEMDNLQNSEIFTENHANNGSEEQCLVFVTFRCSNAAAAAATACNG